MWIRLNDNKLLNLAQAYEVEYHHDKGEIVVWWAGDLPADPDRTERASLFDNARLVQYKVAPNDWLSFSSRALPDG